MANRKYLFGIDIGGTKCAVILGNADADSFNFLMSKI